MRDHIAETIKTFNNTEPVFVQQVVVVVINIEFALHRIYCAMVYIEFI